MQKEIEDTELYRSKVKDRVLTDLCKEWLRVVGQGVIPEFAYDEQAEKWDVPIKPFQTCLVLSKFSMCTENVPSS